MTTSQEKTSFTTITFSKDQSMFMIQKTLQAFQRELKNSFDLISDQRWNTFINQVQKQSDGSLIKLWSLIEAKEWMKQQFLQFKNGEQILKQQNQTQTYAKQLRVYQEEIERRKQLNKPKQKTIQESQLKQQQLNDVSKQQQIQEKINNTNLLSTNKLEQVVVTKDQTSVKKAKIKTLEARTVKSNTKPIYQQTNKNATNNQVQKQKTNQSKINTVNQQPIQKEDKIQSIEKTKQSKVQNKSKKVIILDSQEENNESNKVVNINSISNQPQLTNKKDQKQQINQNNQNKQQQLPIIQPPIKPAPRDKQIEECLKKIVQKFKQSITQNFTFNKQIIDFISNVEFKETLQFIKNIYEQKRKLYLDIDTQLSSLVK